MFFFSKFRLLSLKTNGWFSMAVSDRKQRERQARLNLILDAGLASFSKHGYHNASMDSIAEEAELGKATLYYYFKSKDELLLAILKNGIGVFFEHLEQALSHKASPLEQIKLISALSVRFFREHPDYFKLYLYLNAHPAFRERLLEHLAPVIGSKLKLFRAVFEAAKEEGQIKDLPIGHLISVFGSLVMGVGIFMGGGKVEEPQVIADLINEVFLDGIVRR